jgi:hypothetical protein
VNKVPPAHSEQYHRDPAGETGPSSDADLAHRSARAFLLAADGMDRDTFLNACLCESWMTEKMFADLESVKTRAN